MAITVADLAVRAPKVLPREATIADVRETFSSKHVHIALIVDRGFLVTTLERSDISDDSSDDELAGGYGTLAGRIIGSDASIDEAWTLLNQGKRRRLAVLDETGRLLGLLCLKRSRTGFCSDLGISSRHKELGSSIP
jgi:CBS domain-containing protein